MKTKMALTGCHYEFVLNEIQYCYTSEASSSRIKIYKYCTKDSGLFYRQLQNCYSSDDKYYG